MPLAARVGDPTAHPGILTGPGVATVLIGERPAAVVGVTVHTCAIPSPPGPHPKTPITKGSATVLIGKQQAARMGDTTGCGALITDGAPNVLIGG